MAKSVGFEDVDETNVDELLESYLSELANEDLLEMENNMNDESQEPFFAEPIKQLSTKQMTGFFKHIDSVIRVIEKMILMRLKAPKLQKKFRIIWHATKKYVVFRCYDIVLIKSICPAVHKNLYILFIGLHNSFIKIAFAHRYKVFIFISL
jgi:hypothetical protein